MIACTSFVKSTTRALTVYERIIDSRTFTADEKCIRSFMNLHPLHGYCLTVFM